MAVVQDTITQSRQNNQNTSMSFPSDVGTFASYTRLTFSEYSRSRPSAGKTDKTTATIILPIPTNIEDQFKPNWGQNDLQQYGGMADIAGDWSEKLQSGASIFDLIKSGTESTAANLNSLKSWGTLAMTLTPPGMRDSIIGDIASQSLGVVVNPHLSLMFRGVALREHRLRWEFSPRTEKEAKELGKIISTVRKVTLPKFNQVVSKFALDYPDTCSVEYQGVDSEYKTKIFKSAVTNFHTNLSPSVPSFYPSGRPVRITMELELLETEIVTREDFEAKSETTK